MNQVAMRGVPHSFRNMRHGAVSHPFQCLVRAAFVYSFLTSENISWITEIVMTALVAVQNIGCPSGFLPPVIFQQVYTSLKGRRSLI